ncbi:unnamed protein product [Cuscuta epithymum]|uniref:Uncharacterized protein n=1 Tax=Cuscuta epithymum TaxID=186058 RepID=A0AAV0G804_9ASTE|nr:unnamed protein product [Cuscuta epithymum]
MASTLIESEKYDCFIGENYQTALNNSIHELLDSSRDPDFPKNQSLCSNFQELLRRKPNPPLETVWFSSALDFQSSSSAKSDRPSRQFASIKDLFQLIVARSASFNSWKSVVLIAPVVYEFYRFIICFECLEMSSKKKKLLLEKVKDFAGSILGYINICSDGLCGNFDAMEGLIRPVGDLVDGWIGDSKNAFLREFFPLLSDYSVERISGGELQLSELAGLVTAEAFLLKLCCYFLECSSRKDLKSELSSWIACSISALRNPFFHGALLLMLLEPSLPTSSLLSLEDEVLLRELLYDAVVLVDYSFLNPEQVTKLPLAYVRSITMTRLLVTCEAIKVYRKQGNHKKALSYCRAFSASSLPSQLIKLVKDEIGKDGNTSEPGGSSPAALLRWILNVEKGGAKLFDKTISQICAKLVIDDDANEDPKHMTVLKSGSDQPEEDADLFYVDTKGEENEVGNEEEEEEVKESISAAFVAAAQLMTGSDKKRKTQGRGSDLERKKVKFLRKLNLCDGSAVKPTIPDKDDSDSESGSNVENPSSDDDN